MGETRSPPQNQGQASDVWGHIRIVDQTLGQLSAASPGDVQKIVASQLGLLDNYYKEVLTQATRSFKWALTAAGIGLLFFLGAVLLLLIKERTEFAVIVVISGSIIEVISGVNFFLYGKTTTQLAYFHRCLYQIQRFIIANSICESLEQDYKQKSRAALVKAVITFNLADESSSLLEGPRTTRQKTLRERIQFRRRHNTNRSEK